MMPPTWALGVMAGLPPPWIRQCTYKEDNEHIINRADMCRGPKMGSKIHRMPRKKLFYRIQDPWDPMT